LTARIVRVVQVAKGHGHTQPKRQSIVPRLPLSGGAQDEDAAGLEGQVGGLGWRRLARENLGQKFLERVVNPRRDDDGVSFFYG